MVYGGLSKSVTCVFHELCLVSFLVEKSSQFCYPLCPVGQCIRHRVVISGDVCCSVVFGTLVGVFVFSVMWSELLMTSAISCQVWSSVYE